MKEGQAEASSLPVDSSNPSTRRSPLAAIPTATRAAIDTTLPASRTLRYVASSQRYGKAASVSGRQRNRSTSASRAAQIRLTSLLLMPSMPMARRGSSRLGRYEPSRTRGTARSTVPTLVSQRRSRYPLRWVSRPSGLRSLLAAPVSSVTSASMRAWASTGTPSRRKSTSPSAIALRTVSSTAILIGHCGVPSCRRLPMQRRADDAVAAHVHGPAVTPLWGHDPGVWTLSFSARRTPGPAGPVSEGSPS